jgi:hypothetical protein
VRNRSNLKGEEEEKKGRRTSHPLDGRVGPSSPDAPPFASLEKNTVKNAPHGARERLRGGHG